MFRQVEDRFGQVCHTDLGRFMLESHRSLTSRVHLLRSPHHIYHAVCPKPGGSRGSCANLAVFATGGRHGDYRAGRLEGCLAGGPQRDAVGFAGVCVGGTRLCLEARARIPGPGEGPGQVRPSVRWRRRRLGAFDDKQPHFHKETQRF